MWNLLRFAPLTWLVNLLNQVAVFTFDLFKFNKRL